MKNKAVALPKISDNKEYAAASNKLSDLRLQLIEAEEKRDAILIDMHFGKGQPQRSPIQEAAEKMLEEGSSPETTDEAKLLESYQDLITRISVIKAAIRLQEQVVMDKRSAASLEVVERFRPVHHENVRKIVAKLKELDEALTAEADLREGLSLAGFAAGGLTPMCILELGSLKDPNSCVYRYLMEAFREGFIDQSELPENFPKMTREPKNPVSKALKTRLNALIEAA
ncbi:hypothetical protein SAMN05216404_11928 [Nitrosospira multiformis]|uniref:Uncharacterized protein n=1 Tax=Nitrosospira multiformis TaxID=1231 RepID=A0A1H8P610_9PROT|nr:hypothetical protein [Nitrosospira multiformis]SEO37380.1 hypothetical protein SAMN05216404_11928 [Nitrosospira multiformis]